MFPSISVNIDIVPTLLVTESIDGCGSDFILPACSVIDPSFLLYMSSWLP